MVKKLNCILISWDEILEFSDIVAEKILSANFEPNVIVGITRGGWIPSMLLSDRLQVKDLLSVKIQHWGITAKKDENAKIIVPIKKNLSGKKVLLVDDLTDTGESMLLAKNHVYELNAEEVKTATLIHKEQSSFKPDFYAKKIEKWVWVILPWNIYEDLTNLISKFPEKNLSVDEIHNKLKKEFSIDVDKELIRKVMAKNAIKFLL
ncbi:MAG: phosphoribosyltransferase [Candidatus Altiarchaeota archaeon]